MRVESRDVIAQPLQHEPDLVEYLALLIEKIWNFIFCCCPCTFGTDLQNYNIELINNANQEIADLEESVAVRRIEVQNSAVRSEKEIAIINKQTEISHDESTLSSATNQAILRHMQREKKPLPQEIVDATVYLEEGIWSFSANFPMNLIYEIFHMDNSSDQTLKEFFADKPHHDFLTDAYTICEKSLDSQGRIIGIKVQGVKEAETIGRKKADLEALKRELECLANR